MTRLRRINGWWLFLLAAGLILPVSFYYDSVVQTWMADHQNPRVYRFMHAVSRCGDWPGHMTVGLILLLVAYWRGKKRWMRIFLAMLVACALAGAGNRVIKIATGRARPDVQTEQEWWNGPQLSARYNAFPSGHTAASTAFFATLILVSWRIGLAFSAIPLLVAFSRVYLAAHHLSDVVAGAIIGVIAAYFVTRRIISIESPRSQIRNPK